MPINNFQNDKSHLDDMFDKSHLVSDINSDEYLYYMFDTKQWTPCSPIENYPYDLVMYQSHSNDSRIFLTCSDSYRIRAINCTQFPSDEDMETEDNQRMLLINNGAELDFFNYDQWVKSIVSWTKSDVVDGILNINTQSGQWIGYYFYESLKIKPIILTREEIESKAKIKKDDMEKYEKFIDDRDLIISQIPFYSMKNIIYKHEESYPTPTISEGTNTSIRNTQYFINHYLKIFPQDGSFFPIEKSDLKEGVDHHIDQWSLLQKLYVIGLTNKDQCNTVYGSINEEVTFFKSKDSSDIFSCYYNGPSHDYDFSSDIRFMIPDNMKNDIEKIELKIGNIVIDVADNTGIMKDISKTYLLHINTDTRKTFSIYMKPESGSQYENIKLNLSYKAYLIIDQLMFHVYKKHNHTGYMVVNLPLAKKMIFIGHVWLQSLEFSYEDLGFVLNTITNPY